ncbi:MAG: glycerol-3-phosphate dehydrogenase/oxidase [Actinobacteria bacterium]|nr:MAG: glycerol-3-phosphate dehydrogenase/oxidase [Actinomycetota bacterium]
MDEPAVVRDDALEQLGSREFDLLVIGGGIVGAGIAATATQHGLSVALVDRKDFGGGTSSASSKLIHGGLRYLRLGDVGLVREAHEERRILMRTVAPHLVQQLPFLFPLYGDGPYRPFVLQTAIAVYSTLARAKLNGLVDPERARRMVPELRTEGLRKCGLYVDCWTHDSRLTLANVRAAAEAGATVLNYAEVVALRGSEGAVVEADGRTVDVSARVVVNAAGPWIDSVRRLEDPDASPSVRLSKGVHVVVEPERPWTAALTIPHDKVRVSFAVPWEGMLLLGTTDTLHEGSPDDVAVDDADVEQVLAEAARALDPALVTRNRIRSSFAGLRVLPGGEGATANARRETVYMRGPGGMLTVAGGKLTTYRRIALEALDHVRADLGLHRLDRRPQPLPGAVGLDSVAFPESLDPATRSHLLHLYGSLAEDVVGLAADDPSLLEPIAPGAPDLAAQAVYAARHEWARTPDDFLRRRTTLALRGRTEPEVVQRVERLLGDQRQLAVLREAGDADADQP